MAGSVIGRGAGFPFLGADQRDCLGEGDMLRSSPIKGSLIARRCRPECDVSELMGEPTMVAGLE